MDEVVAYCYNGFYYCVDCAAMLLGPVKDKVK